MSRKFCGCCSNDKLQQDDFRGNGSFGDFSKPYGSDQASKHVLGRTDVTLTSVPQNSHQHTAQRQHNTRIRQSQMSRKFCGCCSMQIEFLVHHCQVEMGDHYQEMIGDKPRCAPALLFSLRLLAESGRYPR